MWISQAQVGDAGLLYAYTDRDKGNKGITAFIIEPKKMKGCTRGRSRPSSACIARRPASSCSRA